MLKIMLIGDSIRLGYQPRLTDLVKDKAVVMGPEENCRFSAHTLWNLAEWVPDSDYDVIQWNNGQWDTCYVADGNIHTPLHTYLELQERIAGVLAPKTQRLIFATTTPVWPEQFEKATFHPRKDGDIREYNAAAVSLLTGMGVEINDLYTVVAADIRRYISDDMVHLTEAGNDLCARRVADIVLKGPQA